LAELAQKWADNCEFNRDAVRAIPGKFSNVGQNIARRKESWERVLKDWVDESHHFNYGNGKSNKYHKANNWLQVVYNIKYIIYSMYNIQYITYII